MAEQTTATRVITGKGLLSFVRVFQPHAQNEGDTEKYSVCFIISKDDKAGVKKLEKAIAAAVEKGKAEKWGGKVPSNLKMPLRDGDEDRSDDPNFENCYFINAKTSRKPGVVGPDRQPIYDEEEMYSGCIGRISINFYPYDSKGNKGVAAGLNNVQKLEDGERLSGGPTAADDFGAPEVEGEDIL